MPPVPDVNVTESTGSDVLGGKPQLYKRGINLNPFHYLTLPLKNNWSTVHPKIVGYQQWIWPVSIILGAVTLITQLEQRNWKLPRWPWANDGRNNPKPNVRHPNQDETVDTITEKKLMEVLEEMREDEVEEEDEGLKEAEEQLVDDAEQGAEDIIEESLDNPPIPKG